MLEYTTNLLIPRQPAAFPMLFFPRRIEHAFDVTIQRSHHTYSGEHRWPFMFCNQCEVEDLGRGADRIKCLECGGDAKWGKVAPEIVAPAPIAKERAASW